MITGCSRVSRGCQNCFAERLAGTRLKHHPSRAGLTRDTPKGPVWTGEVRWNEQWLDQPLRWKRPRMIFVVAHGDLFHEKVPDKWIDRSMRVVATTPQHTYQLLTKRPLRMRRYFCDHVPPSNVWAGTSVEDQATADERIAPFLDMPAQVLWISLEPMLAPVDLSPYLSGNPRLSWVVIGGESGPGARPMELGWAKAVVADCKAAGVPVFMKQGSSANWPAYKDYESFPDTIRVREYPV